MHDLERIKQMNDRAQRRFERKQKQLKQRINEDLQYFVDVGVISQKDVEMIFNATMKSLNVLQN